jgi:hypothetical protein
MNKMKKINKNEKFKNLPLPKQSHQVCTICDEKKDLFDFEEITNFKLNHKRRYFRKNCKKCQTLKRRQYKANFHSNKILNNIIISF